LRGDELAGEEEKKKMSSERKKKKGAGAPLRTGTEGRGGGWVRRGLNQEERGQQSRDKEAYPPTAGGERKKGRKGKKKRRFC